MDRLFVWLTIMWLISSLVLHAHTLGLLVDTALLGGRHMVDLVRRGVGLDPLVDHLGIVGGLIAAQVMTLMDLLGAIAILWLLRCIHGRRTRRLAQRHPTTSPRARSGAPIPPSTAVSPARTIHQPPAWVSPTTRPPVVMVPLPAVRDDCLQRAHAFLAEARCCEQAPTGALLLAACAVDALLQAWHYDMGDVKTRLLQVEADGMITPRLGRRLHVVRRMANAHRHAERGHPCVTQAQARWAIGVARALERSLVDCRPVSPGRRDDDAHTR